jgi:hypothetical protein
MHADLLHDDLTNPALAELSQAADQCIRIVRNFLTLVHQTPRSACRSSSTR